MQGYFFKEMGHFLKMKLVWVGIMVLLSQRNQRPSIFI